MYPVSAAYKTKIKELDRVFEAKIQIQHSRGVLDLTDADIVGGSLIYNESSQAGEDFTIGGTVASDLSVTILNKPEYANYDFAGATITASIGLDIGTGFEYVPLGVFNVDDVGKQRNTIKIKAIDNMINLNKPYSLSKLGYPATLFQIYIDACNVCDVMPAMGSFTNSNYVVQERPDDDMTFRDIIGYIAELSGSFARMNRVGALEFAWHTDSGITLTGANRFNFIPRDDVVQIDTVTATVDDVTYIAGEPETFFYGAQPYEHMMLGDYSIDLTENPLLQGKHPQILSTIYSKIKNTSFYPYESSWQGNPAIQAGDMLIQIDRDGKEYPTLVTSSTYKYRGASTLKAKGLPVIAKGFKGSTNRKIAEIKRRVEKDIGDKLTTLEQAQLHATELIANMLGGYAIKADDAFYVADNPDLDLAQKVWKWGLGGFGYSSTGKDGPYTTAITADGSIVAMLVAANIITADMVNTGELRSVDGSTRINLDDGTFNFKDVLKYVNQVLSITGLNGVEISSDLGVKATHSETGEYTQLNSDGLKRFVPIPIYTEVPTGVPNFEGFEDGVFPDDWFGAYRTIINTDKRSGSYCLEIPNLSLLPMVRVTKHITKDCEFSFWYKSLVTVTFLLNGEKHTLSSSGGVWTQFTKNITKGFNVFQWESGYVKDAEYGLRLDDIMFEQNPVNYVIDSYTSQGYDYSFRTFVGSAATYGQYSYSKDLYNISYNGSASHIPDIWIQLPDDFKNKNFEIILSFKNIDTTSTQWASLHKIELEVLETDYVNARFKVRARAHSYHEYYFLDFHPVSGDPILRAGEGRVWAGFNFIYLVSY